jgi:hypothetical protein
MVGLNRGRLVIAIALALTVVVGIGVTGILASDPEREPIIVNAITESHGPPTIFDTIGDGNLTIEESNVITADGITIFGAVSCPLSTPSDFPYPVYDCRDSAKP